jgi:hypothetical protein
MGAGTGAGADGAGAPGAGAPVVREYSGRASAAGAGLRRGEKSGKYS